MRLLTVFSNLHRLDLNANKGSETILNLDKHHRGSSVRKLDFLGPEKLITAAKSVKVYDLNTGKFVRKLENKDKTRLYSLKPINENVFFTGDDVGCLKMYDLRTGDEPLMNEKQNEDYLSDMDIDSSNRILLTTSGDGHLSAFNVKSKKFVLQSEPFDSGFQSVRFLGHRNKVVVGAEDGALNIFNVGEWGNISDRIPLSKKRSFGECSIDGIEVVSERLIIASGSDGGLRLVSMFPNKILCCTDDHDGEIECIHYNPKTELVLSAETDRVFVHRLQLNGEEANEQEDEVSEESEKRSKKKQRTGSKPSNSSFFSDL